MNEELADKLDALISELDTACGMLIVAAMSNPVVKEAHEKVMNVSVRLADIINDDILVGE